MRISVIGVGKLGLCVALCLERAGHEVMGVDVNPIYIEKLKDKTLFSYEPQVMELLQKSQKFTATTSLIDALNFADLLFIFVATPSGGGNNYYDHSMVSNLLEECNRHKLKNKHFVIGCTVMPSYTDNVAKLLLEDCVNCTISYSPEFIAQNEIIHGYTHPDMILIGEGSKEAGDVISKITLSVLEDAEAKQVRVCRMTPLEAEITKIALNGFITTKIAYANTIGDLAEAAGADKNIVLSAIGQDSRIGTKCFKARESFGGPCFPRDTLALHQCLTKLNVQALIPAATHEANHLHVITQAQQLINSSPDGKIKKSDNEYVFEDVCYKPGCTVPIITESAKLKIAKYLVDKGNTVTIRDRKPVINEVKKEFGGIFGYIEMTL